ncbi:MAG: DUF5131 family protein, partial [Sulfolobales archaeon]
GFVFVSDMGDLFCDEIPDEWILKVLEHVGRFPNTYFLFLTKNPSRYLEFTRKFPPNAVLGATIETDSDALYLESRPPISRAPPPSARYRAMAELDWPMKFVSVEPVLDFDLERFTKWIREIDPFMVYVGYDNYGHRLPEPPMEKTLRLVEALSEFTLVVKKTIRPAWHEREPRRTRITERTNLPRKGSIQERVPSQARHTGQPSLRSRKHSRDTEDNKGGNRDSKAEQVAGEPTGG